MYVFLVIVDVRRSIPFQLFVLSSARLCLPFLPAPSLPLSLSLLASLPLLSPLGFHGRKAPADLVGVARGA